jgi:hypothetical protein
LTKPREVAADRDAFEAALKALQGLKADAIVSAVGANLTDFGLSPAAGSLEMKLKDAPKSIQLDIGATRPEGTFLRRPGDDYLLRVPAAALAAYGRPATEFVSRELVTASTYDAGHVEVDLVEGGALTKRLTFDKNEANRWTRPKETDEVKGFADLLDACLHAKGTEVLAAEPASTALAAPGIEVRIYRRLYNDPKGDDKEKDRIATVRFARTPDGAWLGSGITGSALTGGIAMKVAEDLPGKLTGLAFGAESKPASAPESAPASVPASKPK